MKKVQPTQAQSTVQANPAVATVHEGSFTRVQQSSLNPQVNLAADPFAQNFPATVDNVIDATGKLEVDTPPYSYSEHFQPHEIEKIMTMAKQISPQNAVLVGESSAKASTDSSQKLLNALNVKDLGEMTAPLNEVIKCAQSFDFDSLSANKKQKTGILGFFNKGKDSFADFVDTFKSTDTKVCGLEKIIQERIKGIAFRKQSIQKLAESLIDRYGSLRFETEALGYYCHQKQIELKRRSDAANPLDIPTLQKIRMEEDQLNDAFNNLDFLRRLKTQIHQKLPMVALVKKGLDDSERQLKQVLQFVIPNWRDTMVIVTTGEFIKETGKLSDKIDEFDNKLHAYAADLTASNAKEMALRNGRQGVSLDTLKQTNEKLIAAFNDSRTIEAETRRAQLEAVPQLEELSAKLNAALTQRFTQTN